MDRPIAHITKDGRKHDLYEHLTSTARRASEFANKFGCGEWGYLAGLWHDMGKYSEDFQRKIHNTQPYRVDHSTAGAIYATRKFGKSGRILSYIIAGHHAGLTDWQTAEAGNRSLINRLQNNELLKKVLESRFRIPAEITGQSLPDQRFKTRDGHALWIRMLYSCLIDADFLDTEKFFEPEKADIRKNSPSLQELLPLFDSYMADKLAKAAKTLINKYRAEIFRQCVTKSSHKPAIFTLTVPTGGGKTLSSMAFAMNHAVKKDKNRIIYVIPYTSIIEQTANEFRQIFGDAVIEHHSNIIVADESSETVKSRLACENWDATIIVTTSVQFFESLFSNRPGRCRKLHNIVNSVVVLDEVQLLPPEYLNPILHAIKELHQNYKVTFVLSTATQPALTPHKSTDYSFEGLSDAVEIMDDPPLLYKTFNRVEVNVPDDLITPRTWEDLASELSQHHSVLCIVNRRDDCRALYELMPEGSFHLSALMCGEHRSIVINQIKQGLKDRIPTRVISTQLVEAGVDLDFPVVYRALAGLDSIAQAAGRCNREGLLERGRLTIFVPPSKFPPGYLQQAGEITRRLIAGSSEDVLSLDRFEQFFKEFYWIQGNNLDKYNILEDIKADGELRISFLSAAQKFKLIDDLQYAPVVVCYGEGSKLIEELKEKGPDRWLLRRLQRYIVNIPRHIHVKLHKEGSIVEVHPGIFIQMYEAMYHPELGFCPDRSMIYEPDSLIA